MVLTDRIEAGKMLSEKVQYLQKNNPVVVALARGGVPVGFEIARRLDASLEVFVVRKIGAPYQKEFGIGALAENEVEILEEETITNLEIPRNEIEATIQEEKQEIDRRVSLYRRGKPLMDLQERTVILVDDGLATGVSAKAAILALQKKRPKAIIFAVPVCALKTAVIISPMVTKLISLALPYEFESVGQWYEEFDQIDDEEVIALLEQAKQFGHKYHLGGTYHA